MIGDIAIREGIDVPSGTVHAWTVVKLGYNFVHLARAQTMVVVMKGVVAMKCVTYLTFLSTPQARADGKSYCSGKQEAGEVSVGHSVLSISGLFQCLNV